MVLVIVAAVFLATGLLVLAAFLILEGRREALPQRFREVVSRPEAKPSGPVARLRKLWESRWTKAVRAGTGREELIERFTGERLSGARLLLNQAGYRSQAALRFYWWVQIGLPLALSAGIFIMSKSAGIPNRQLLLLVVCGGVAGLLLPNFYLRLGNRRRQEEITDALPDALDLLVVCVEAGLGINAAFIKVTEEFKINSPALSEEFDVVNREMVAGKPRQEALRALSDRTGVEDVKSLVAMLVQTEKLGTSLAQSLRVHSDSLRTRRRQRAEEAAAKTTIKLVFPLVFLIFPALFVVLLGPGMVQVYRILVPTITK